MLGVKFKNFVISSIATMFFLSGSNINAQEIQYISVPVIQELPIEILKKEPFQDTIIYSEKDLFCLAKNIYHEARGESENGRRAVAQVTLNRVRSPKFKNTICGVVYEPYQFSWTTNKSQRWSVPSGKMWAESQQLAKEILINGRALDNLDNALFFHSRYVNPGWRRPKLATIGNHIFYS